MELHAKNHSEHLKNHIAMPCNHPQHSVVMPVEFCMHIQYHIFSSENIEILFVCVFSQQWLTSGNQPQDLSPCRGFLLVFASGS